MCILVVCFGCLIFVVDDVIAAKALVYVPV
jgi:hypothetical protein